jgi:IS30 family transposase
MASTPVSEAERERIRQLHGEGASVNAIAKQLRRSTATIHTHARSLGLSFDRSKVAAASAARRADAEVRRRELAENLLDDAQQFRQRIWGEFKQVQYVGKDGERVEDVLSEPPPKEQLDYARAMQIVLTQTLKLVEFDREKDASRLAMADQFLKAMMGGDPGGDAGGE